MFAFGAGVSSIPAVGVDAGGGVCVSDVGRVVFVEHALSRRAIAKAAAAPLRWCPVHDMSERILQRAHGGKDVDSVCIGRQVPR